MKYINQSILLVFLLLPLLCFSNNESSLHANDSLPALVKTGEKYGKEALQDYDIYLPANRSRKTTPLLILIHGGGWQEGDKTNYNNQISGLRNIFPHYAIATINYRLYANGKNKFPLQEADVKKVIEYILDKSKGYNISKKYALMGNSAGAHLALLYAYKYGKRSYKPTSVISFVGPTDMQGMFTNAADSGIRISLKRLIGDPASKDSLLYKSSSPIHFVNAQSPPTLMFYGTADNLVPHTQGELLKAKLDAYNVKNIIRVYEGAGHDLSGAWEDLITNLVSFLKTYLP